MKITAFIFAALIAFAPMAYADPALPDTNATPLPGLNDEGPPGCGWRATVTDVHPGDAKSVDLVLLQMVGTCMYKPGPCGVKGDQLSATVNKGDLRGYTVGQIIKVWVTGTAVSFDRPDCVRNPG